MEIIFMNTGNYKTNESHNFVLKFSQVLDLRSSNIHVTFQNSSIHYIWKNIRQQYKTSKLKISAPTSNDEFELPYGSYSLSDIENCIEYIIKIIKYYSLTLILIFTSIVLTID